MTTGKLIRYYRTVQGKTQRELAFLSNLSTIAIQQYEGERRTPRIENLRSIALALGVTIEDLLPDDEPFYEQENTVSLGEKEILYKLFDELNEAGRKKALERIQELTEIPRYQVRNKEAEPDALDTQKDE